MNKSKHEQASDQVDEFRKQWQRELPDVDTEGMAIIGRARRITLALRGGIEEIFAKHGLDAGGFDVVAALLRSGPPHRLRPTELFRGLMVSSGGLTDRLARLETAGLVHRICDDNDRRSLLVELTAKGRRYAETAFREDMAHEKAALQQLSRAEREQLSALLRKLWLSIDTQVSSDEPVAAAKPKSRARRRARS
jgi:DNA-binding MarR family transcriptional regulator